MRAVVGLALPLRAPSPIVAPFVGRQRERDQLAALRVRQQRDRDCAVALIVGASGVGKTALARRFLDEHVAALPDAIVLESRCDERETVPFNALDGIVDGLARIVTRHPDRLPPRALEALRSRDASELRRLFPVLAEVSLHTAASSLRSTIRVASAARALRDVLDAIAREKPLVLLIDDAQWADADSGALLADLLAAPRAGAAARRDGAWSRATARCRRHPTSTRVTLGGLEVEDAVALAAAVVDEPIDAAAIAREAQGHPMFIAELSRFAAERRSAAGSLDDALWSRACDLTQRARRLLHVDRHRRCGAAVADCGRRLAGSVRTSRPMRSRSCAPRA